MSHSYQIGQLISTNPTSFHLHVVCRGGARNFGLGGPSCDANILVKTNLYTHMYIN